MLLGPDNRVTVPSLSPAPPLGVGLTDPDDHTLDVLPFGPDDTLLLYTDGVTEARDRYGAFYRKDVCRNVRALLWPRTMSMRSPERS